MLAQVSNQSAADASSASINGGGSRGPGGHNQEEEDRRRRAAATRALFSNTGEGEDDDVVLVGDGRIGDAFTRRLGSLTRWLTKKGPLAGDVRTVQARFGDSVASYFIFSRWAVCTL